MVNKKITDLDAISSEADTDLLEIVGSVATTPASYKTSRLSLFNHWATYGEIYVHNGSTTQTSIGTSYVAVTGFATNGESSNTTPTVASDKIALTRTGVYRVTFQVSFSGSPSTTFVFAPHLDGTEIQSCANQRRMNSGGATGSCGATGCFEVTAAGDLDLRVKADDTDKNIVLTYGQLYVERIKGS